MRRGRLRIASQNRFFRGDCLTRFSVIYSNRGQKVQLPPPVRRHPLGLCQGMEWWVVWPGVKNANALNHWSRGCFYKVHLTNDHSMMTIAVEKGTVSVYF